MGDRIRIRGGRPTRATGRDPRRAEGDREPNRPARPAPRIRRSARLATHVRVRSTGGTIVAAATGATATIRRGNNKDREGGMSNVPEGNRFAPPVAHVEDVVVSGAGELAGRWTRLGAAFIDGLLALLIFWIISLFTPFSIFRPELRGGMMTVLIQNTLIGFVIFLLLHGYLLQTRGQTIGKMLLHVRIVRTDGSKATLVRLAGLRYFANSVIALIPVVGWLYGLVDALMIFRDSRKCLHDNIADTIVVKA
jgi:uncharacterized RDD family membrane protein YckC